LIVAGSPYELLGFQIGAFALRFWVVGLCLRNSGWVRGLGRLSLFVLSYPLLTHPSYALHTTHNNTGTERLMPSVRRGCSLPRSLLVCLLSFIVIILLLTITPPRVAAFSMVTAARRKASGVSAAAAAALHKKTAAPAAVVVCKAVTSTSAQSSSSSSSSGGLQEKYGNPERPLRLILIGHNPSAAAWRDGHYYSNPSNRMWRLLGGAGIIPLHYSAKDDDSCPSTCGIGFTDLVRIHKLYVQDGLYC